MNQEQKLSGLIPHPPSFTSPQERLLDFAIRKKKNQHFFYKNWHFSFSMPQSLFLRAALGCPHARRSVAFFLPVLSTSHKSLHAVQRGRLPALPMAALEGPRHRHPAAAAWVGRKPGRRRLQRSGGALLAASWSGAQQTVCPQASSSARSRAGGAQEPQPARPQLRTLPGGERQPVLAPG